MKANSTRSSIRALGALAALVLAVASCGGDDDATDDTAPDTTVVSDADDDTGDDATADAGGGAGDDAGTPPMQPSAISFEPQASDGRSVTVASVELPASGFIAVHGDGGGAPGPVIGHSDLLPAGTSADVIVTLDEPLTADATVYPMVHIDTDRNGLYEFGVVDGVDGPGLTAEGDVAVTGAVVAVTAGAEPGDDAGAGAATITIADFAFDGATEVTAGTTVVVTNTDSSPHTWTAEDGTFDSGALGQGESFEFTFTEPGEFTYACNFHPSMTGTITVTG